MNEKYARQPTQADMALSRFFRRVGVLAGVLLIALGALRTWQWITPGQLHLGGLAHDAHDAPVHVKKLVPLEAHIISKCPDTRDALRQLILPVMQRVHDKVDFKLSYIGTPTDDDGIACMHGPSECLGNIIELCAHELYPEPKTYLGFVMCLTKDYRHIPERSLVEDCALEHALDFQALNECATRDDGAHGISMLRDSVARTSEAGVTVSCTIRLNEEIYCIHDNGDWIACPHGAGVNDLVVAIEKQYRSS